MKENTSRYFLRRFPITRRFFILILVVSILPILLVGNYSYLSAKKNVQMLSMDYNQKLIDASCSNMNLIVQNYIQLSDELMLSRTVINTLKNYPHLDSAQKHTALSAIYQEYCFKYQRIANVFDTRIVTTSNIPVLNTGHLILDGTSFQEKFDRIRSHSASTLWNIATHGNETFFVLSRKITEFSNSEDIGYIIMHIRPTELINIISDNDSQISLTMVDSFHEAFSLTAGGPAFSEDTIRFIFSQPQGDAFLIRENADSEEYSTTYTQLHSIGWNMIASTPVSYLASHIKSIRTGSLYMIVFIILFCIAFSLYILQSISRPLTEMIQNIEGLSNMNFKEHLAKNQKDELGFLSNAYAVMLNKIQDMTVQIANQQEEKRKAEIKMLQAQINPHFLFNTLDSLKFTALMSNAPTVSEGLSSLSHILRNSILGADNYISIGEEAKNIEDYLTIQKIRYGETVQLHKEIDPEAKACVILKFLLQPIVENSIIHGALEDSQMDITLRVKQEGANLVITLQDNGKGFDIDSQEPLRDPGPKDRKLSGIGLENIRQRLWLEYGNSQSFAIESRLGEGTKVTISYPFQKKEVTGHVQGSDCG